MKVQIPPIIIAFALNLLTTSYSSSCRLDCTLTSGKDCCEMVMLQQSDAANLSMSSSHTSVQVGANFARFASHFTFS